MTSSCRNEKKVFGFESIRKPHTVKTLYTRYWCEYDLCILFSRLQQQMHAQQLPHAAHAPPIPMMPPHPGMPGPPGSAGSLLGLAGLAGTGAHPLSMLTAKPDLHRDDKSNSGKHRLANCISVSAPPWGSNRFLMCESSRVCRCWREISNRKIRDIGSGRKKAVINGDDNVTRLRKIFQLVNCDLRRVHAANLGDRKISLFKIELPARLCWSWKKGNCRVAISFIFFQLECPLKKKNLTAASYWKSIKACKESIRVKGGEKIN